MAGEERPSSKIMPRPMPSEIKHSEAQVEGSIKVVALLNGWYKCSRKVAGEVFTIENEKQLGKWMKKI